MDSYEVSAAMSDQPTNKVMLPSQDPDGRWITLPKNPHINSQRPIIMFTHLRGNACYIRIVPIKGDRFVFIVEKR